jgi:hypothetical protein
MLIIGCDYHPGFQRLVVAKPVRNFMVGLYGGHCIGPSTHFP